MIIYISTCLVYLTLSSIVTHDPLQKLIFLDTAEGVASMIRPYWAEATGDRASVVQAVPDMLEIVPPGTSKGSGVRILLDHLGATPDEVRCSITPLQYQSLYTSFQDYVPI